MASSGTGHSTAPKPQKLCFVTIGATAPFNSLLAAVLNASFFEALYIAGYTDLLIQYGHEGAKLFDEASFMYPPESRQRFGLNLVGFNFNSGGLGQEMRRAKGDRNLGTTEGVVISHAGTESPIKVSMLRVDSDRVLFRIWLYSRCAPSQRAHYCRPQYGFASQPPVGIGRGACGAGICSAWEVNVRFPHHLLVVSGLLTQNLEISRGVWQKRSYFEPDRTVGHL